MLAAMPRGNPKRPTTLRLRPGLVEAVATYGVPLTQAIEEGLDWWLAREKRRKPGSARKSARMRPRDAA
jgi:hypothetical protein